MDVDFDWVLSGQGTSALRRRGKKYDSRSGDVWEMVYLHRYPSQGKIKYEEVVMLFGRSPNES